MKPAVATRVPNFTWKQVLRRPALIVWCLFIASQPIYILDSGLPQPGDFLLLPLIPLALSGWNRRLSPESARPMRILMLFTGWVMLVNYAWALITGNFGLVGKDTYLLFPIYYVYNASVVFVALVLYHRYGTRFLSLTLRLVLMTVLLQVLLSFFFHGTRITRSSVLFNNPNQLGYFAMLSACMIALCQRRLRYSTLLSGIGLTACVYLALLSASKAGVGGTLLLLAVTVIANPRVLVAAAIAIGLVLAVGGKIEQAIDTTHTRMLENRRPQHTFFEQRGYDRILQHKEHLLLGAGEGGTSRFSDTTVIGTHEIHSSAGTVLFSYGIAGACLFLAFIVRVIQRASLRSALMLLPALAYTIAHQGLRFTSLWILIGLFICIKQPPRDEPIE